MQNQLAVIKLGGHAMDSEEHLEAFADDLTRLRGKGLNFIIAHGGGPQISAHLRMLGIESKFANGLRITDAATLAVVEMILCGAVNKSLTRRLLKKGIPALGISGEDGAMLTADVELPELGRVGEITKVNAQPLEAMLRSGYTPVVAPLAIDAAFEPLNINGDTAAGAIAGALRADFFVLISDVPGVLNGEGQLMHRLTSEEIAGMRRQGIIHGGMIPKTECCLSALAEGARNAVILDGRQRNSLARFIIDGEKLGTNIALRA